MKALRVLNKAILSLSESGGFVGFFYSFFVGDLTFRFSFACENVWKCRGLILNAL